MAPDPATVTQEAQAVVSALLQEARDHKRLAQRHRHKAQKTMQDLQDHIEWCRENGISVEMIINPKPEGTQVHGHYQHGT